MTTPEAPHNIANVLVIAADSNIESLVGELVAFAGFRPLYDVTTGAAGESIRRARPEVAIVDTALPRAIVRACRNAATESGAQMVLMSSTASAAELADEAAQQRALHFALPGGPKQLRLIIERALDRRGAPRPEIPDRRSAQHPAGSVHPALCAALATVARARLLTMRASSLMRTNVELRELGKNELANSKRSHAALRAAVADYAAQLKGAKFSEDDAVVQIRDTIADCAAIIGAESEMDTILGESEGWTREVYRAA